MLTHEIKTHKCTEQTRLFRKDDRVKTFCTFNIIHCPSYKESEAWLHIAQRK